MTVRGVYYVKDVHPAHLRLIGLFTGEERNLPREYCLKISLDNLSKLHFQLQSLQLQKVSDNLFRSNKYLGPDASKTWNYLLNKNNPMYTDDANHPDNPDQDSVMLDPEGIAQPTTSGKDPAINPETSARQYTLTRHHHQTIQ